MVGSAANRARVRVQYSAAEASGPPVNKNMSSEKGNVVSSAAKPQGILKMPPAGWKGFKHGIVLERHWLDELFALFRAKKMEKEVRTDENM